MKPESPFIEEILHLPFIDEILLLVCFLIIAPAIWGIYQISLGSYFYGVLLIFAWGLLFLPLCRFLNRRKIARLFITLPGSALILFFAVWVIFAE
jgi:hypothetical protein